MWQKSDIKYIKEHIKDKKHIIITGAIGSGKSTLLNELRNQFEFGDCIPGLITWNDQGKAVYMRKFGEDEFVAIGECNPYGLSAEKRMQPVPNGFNVYGVSLLDMLIDDDSEWIMIDEIGFLESDCQPYLKKLFELFDKKRVMAVVRKQEIKHIHEIVHRKDAMVIDLDNLHL